MGEFVGVNPANLAELGKRLRRLHDVLSKNGPIIQQTMQRWGSEVSFAPLPRLTDAALNDTRDMDARVSKAYRLADEKGWDPRTLRPLRSEGTAFIGPPSPYVQLDWDAIGQGGYQAEQDVQALKTALAAAKDPERLCADLGQLQRHLTQHLNDKDYLAAFWAQAAPLALQAARALYNRAGTSLFSEESVSILRALGSSLAAASQMRVGTGKDSRPLLSPETRAAIAKSSDPWSVGMLFKYGPDGKSWDSQFLAEVTRAMLDARAAGKVEIPLPHQRGGILDRDRAIYQKHIADFDPVVAVMDRAAQNGKAARHVLGDPDTGLKYAKMLIGDDWRTPGVKVGVYGKASGADPSLAIDRVDLSEHPAEFLKAAVSAARGAGKDAKESAWSVVHIVQATSEFAKLHPETVLPRQIRQALMYTADRYLPDFAKSIGHDYSSQPVPKDNDPANPWTVVIKTSELESMLAKAFHLPEEFGTFKGIMNARVPLAVAATIKDPSDADYLSEMAGLYGAIQRLENDQRFSAEQLKDIEAQRNQTALGMLTGGFGALNFTNPWGPGTIAQFLTGVTSPLINESFSTDHAVKAIKENADTFRKQVLSIEVPVIQGLINAGAIQPPKDATWLKNGTLTPDANFVEWVSGHAESNYGGKTLLQWIRSAQVAMRMQQ